MGEHAQVESFILIQLKKFASLLPAHKTLTYIKLVKGTELKFLKTNLSRL